MNATGHDMLCRHLTVISSLLVWSPPVRQVDLIDSWFVQCSAMHCTALHCAAIHYTALHCGVVQLLGSAVQCIVLRVKPSSIVQVSAV